MNYGSIWDPRHRLLTMAEAAVSAQRPESTVRRWVAEGRLVAAATAAGQPLFREIAVLDVESHARRGDARWRRARTAALAAHPPRHTERTTGSLT